MGDITHQLYLRVKGSKPTALKDLKCTDCWGAVANLRNHGIEGWNFDRQLFLTIWRILIEVHVLYVNEVRQRRSPANAQ